MDTTYLKRVYWKITGMIMLVMILSLALASYYSHRSFERALVPEVATKAQTMGATVRTLILKAIGHRIDFHDLYGVDLAFASVVDSNPEFEYMAATDVNGKVLYQSGKAPLGIADYSTSPKTLALLKTRDVKGPVTYTTVGDQYLVSLPIHSATAPLGLLHIGIGRAFVDRVMLEVLLDVIVVLVVALFVTLELLSFIAGSRLESGLRTFAGVVERVRKGDFSARAEAGTNDEIGHLLGRVDTVLVGLNRQYQELTRDLQARVKHASQEQRERLRGAVEAWESLQTRFRFGSSGETPGGQEDRLVRIRAPLFVFILAEELTRSFLPNYVNQLLVPIPWMSPQVVIGLPIVLFMLIVAIGQPYLGTWSERIGRRKAMLIGAAVATVGFGGTAIAINLYDLLFWRSLCALGYGMVFVAAQGYVLDYSGAQNRAKGFALFIGAIMVATVCGPSIGGILADNIGNRLSFMVSAALAALSIITIRLLPSDVRREQTTRQPTIKEMFALMVNPRFMTLTGLAAMPAKIVLTGFCFYLVPLYIVSIGSTQSMAGRMLMVYAVMMVLIVPIAAALSDAGAKRERLVALGLCLSGLGGFLLLISKSFLIVFAVVFMLGLGQALSIASQSALVAEHCQDEIRRYGSDAVFGVYRLLERMGNAIGPLLASVLVIYYDYHGAFIAISGIVLTCGILFTLLTRGQRPDVAPAGAD